MKPVNEDRLMRTYDYIVRYSQETGDIPTYKEILESCGQGSMGMLSQDIARLKECGLLISKPYSNRGIALPDKARFSSATPVAVVGSVHCGSPEEAIQDISGYMSVPDDFLHGDDYVLLRAVGRSMVKRGIFPGDLLLVKRQMEAPVGSIVIASIDGRETTAKILRRDRQGFFLSPASDELDDNALPYADIRPEGEWFIVGTVEMVFHDPNIR